VSLRSPRSALTGAAILTVGVAFALVAPASVIASQGGTNVGLTATNNSTQISWANGSHLTTDMALEGAWSPDGSRVAFVNDVGNIETVRYNNGQDTDLMYVNGSGFDNMFPTWISNSTVLWAQDGRALAWAVGDTALDICCPGEHSGRNGTVQLPNTLSDIRHPDAATNGVIVFSALGDVNDPEGVYSITRDQVFATSVIASTLVVSNATQPSISPDGAKVAWIRLTDDVQQVFVSDVTGDNVVQVTSDAGDKDALTWSPDGSTIAFRNNGSDGTIDTAAADGSQAAAPILVPGLTGVPAYQTTRTDAVTRLAGQDRFGTAIAISQSQWATFGDAPGQRQQAGAVVLTRSDTFADALGGAALAAAKQGPLLMTPPTSLNADIAGELRRVLGSNPSAKVYILGGSGAISPGIQDAIHAMGYETTRLAGTNRYATAIAIAKEINPHPDYVLSATGMDFPDALGAGAAAASYDVAGTGRSAVVVLTAGAVIPSDTRAYIDGLNKSTKPPQLWAIGGPATIALSKANYAGFTVAGDDRYQTSLGVADAFFSGVSHVGIATGTTWPDALCGGAMLGALDAPMILTAPASVPVGTGEFLSGNSPWFQDVVIFGGTGAVDSTVASEVGTLISGPGGFTTVTVTPGAEHPMATPDMTSAAGNGGNDYAPDTSAPGVRSLRR
jgi:hypothetical protein